MNWRADAACLGYPDWWFTSACFEQAREICNRCVVATVCLEEAMRLEPSWAREGMFGGLTPDERSLLDEREPRVAVCGSDSGYFAHRRRGDSPCVQCRYAHAQKERERTQRRRMAI